MTSPLSAGRVQSAALHIIIDKENEVKAHKSTAYWNIAADFDLTFNKSSKAIQMQDVKLYHEGTIQKFTQTDDVLSVFKNLNNKFKIVETVNKLVKQSADLPYITSSLQQDAYSKLGFPLKRTMQVAQALYESGFITYMRTDSFNMSDDFKEQAKLYIDSTFGEEYYEGGSKRRKVVKGAQEAHECIRVTDPSRVSLPDSAEKEQKNLYDMIWKRTIAHLIKPAIYDELVVKITDQSFQPGKYFNTSFKTVKFNGYLVVYGVQNESNSFKDIVDNINKGNYKLTCNVLSSKNIWTSPPARYNESSIVKVLESEGLGRPSTYSTILSKLFERRYIFKTDVTGETKASLNISYDPKSKKIDKEQSKTVVGAEKSKLVPTDIGIEIDKYLTEHFSYIVDKNFTALMENDLDKIAEGSKDKSSVLGLFWKRFGQDVLNQSGKTTKQVLRTESKQIEVDGNTYTIRLAKFGPVIQYDDNKYISLKAYLTLAKKQYTDIDEEDIGFLRSLPKTIAIDNGKPILLAYGPYGLYLKVDGQNFGMPKRLAFKIYKNEDVSLDDLRKAIDYKNNKTKKSEKPKDSGSSRKQLKS
jgi:DNA topoisomerase-1